MAHHSNLHPPTPDEHRDTANKLKLIMDLQHGTRYIQWNAEKPNTPHQQDRWEPTRIKIFLFAKNDKSPKFDDATSYVQMQDINARLLSLLERLHVSRRPGLGFFHHLFIPTFSRSQFLLKGQPLLEQESGLLGLHLLTRVNSDCSLLVLQPEDSLEQAAHLLGIAGLHLQVDQNVPQVDTLGERGEQALKNGAATLDIAIG